MVKEISNPAKNHPRSTAILLSDITDPYPSTLLPDLCKIVDMLSLDPSPSRIIEICKYETSMTMNTLSEVQDNVFVQFVFDNADRNTRTVDGHGTFHVMGGVQCVTPVSAVQTCYCIPP
ncbi:hypothetical protein AVEN_88601-1 [Araneus ventricosus]|uniref:Uncharacterized protein n=1 Tax=Araneus ventricosus TaxID=182803 RepID=A0A4Y2FR63_ARAVE|nr:hypothetical protein AVEN_88601-1 [Araneus ventricosus]